MALTAPYKQHSYMGEYGSDADCLTFIRDNLWDSAGNGTGNPQNGMWYYSTASHAFRGYFNGTWVFLVLTNDTRLTDDRTASGLRSATTVVAVSTATAPTSGQVLTATGGTGATWQTPAVSSDKTVLFWGNLGVSNTTTTRYMHPGFVNDTAATVPIQFRVPFAGTVRNLRVRHNTPAGNGNNIVYTVRINSVASLLTITMASTASDGNDLVNTPSVAAGDLIDLEVTKAANIVTSPSNVTVTLELRGA